MSVLELSSYLMDTLDDVYKLTSQMVIGCSFFSQEFCKQIGRYWLIMRRLLYVMIFKPSLQIFIMF